MIGKLQQADIENCKQQQICGHNPYADSLLYMSKHHRHKGAPDIGGGHLQTNNCRTVAFAKVGRSHVLNRRINGPHVCPDHDKSNNREDISRYRQYHQQDAKQLHRNADADQQLIPKLIGDKAGNHPAKHQAEEDQGAKGCNGLVAQAGFCPGKVTGRPQERGCLAGTVGKESNQR